MKNHYGLPLAVAVGLEFGAVAIGGLHARTTTPPVHVVVEIDEVSDAFSDAADPAIDPASNFGIPRPDDSKEILATDSDSPTVTCAATLGGLSFRSVA